MSWNICITNYYVYNQIYIIILINNILNEKKIKYMQICVTTDYYFTNLWSIYNYGVRSPGCI
jgi:hypothetical protein